MQDALVDLSDLLVEAWDLIVSNTVKNSLALMGSLGVYIHQCRVSNPSSSELLVNIDGNTKVAFVSGSVVVKSVVFFCTFSSSDHVNDSIVSFVSDVDHAPSVLVHNRLPTFRADVRLGVQGASIAQDNGVLATDFSKFDEAVF